MIHYFETNHNIKPSNLNQKNNLEPLKKQVHEYREKYKINIDVLKNYFCKIFYKNTYLIGFFATIPYKSRSLNVLITNIEINENYILSNNKIEIYLNNEEKKIICLDKERKSYSNKEFDISFIEIKDMDKINDFFNLDDEIIKILKYNKEEIIDYYNKLYKGNYLYILNYKDSKIISISLGKLTEIKENNIEHTCDIDDEDFPFSPIINLKTNKLIGYYNLQTDVKSKLIIFI